MRKSRWTEIVEGFHPRLQRLEEEKVVEAMDSSRESQLEQKLQVESTQITQLEKELSLEVFV